MKTYTHCSITIAQSGFAGRRVKYRIAVASRPELLTVSGASKTGRDAIKAGDLRILYMRGRECDAIWEAARMGYVEQ